MPPFGTPCWLDLTTDMDRARPFYAAVLGWTFEDLGPEFGGWQIASAGGHQVAALGPGTPRDWQVYLGTPDVAAAVATVIEAGGTVPLPPGQVGALGWAAAITDPGGATVGLWQAGDHVGFTCTGEPGQPWWFEVNTRDGVAVRDFFASCFGLTHEKQPDKQYYTLHADDRRRFGVLQMNHMWDGMDPSWMTYFAVSDIEAAPALVAANGGTCEYGPFDTPFGRIAICRDPMGTPLTLVSPAF